MSMLKVLGRATSGNVQKVLWLLEELPRDYTREDYGRQYNNTTDAAYLALNPNAKVPTLVDGDIVVWESNTILRYVCNRTACDLYPEEPAERSHVERWMDWQLSVLNNPYVAIFKESKKPVEERSADLPEHAKELAAALTILDAALDDREWLAADGISFLAGVSATTRGFILVPRRARDVVVLAPPVEEEHAAVLALLADGESWSSSALALALGASQRTVQRALDALAAAGKVQSFGRGRARRWMTPPVPGFPTTLLLPAQLPSD
jgi:glutathione S-transferase